MYYSRKNDLNISLWHFVLRKDLIEIEIVTINIVKDFVIVKFNKFSKFLIKIYRK